MRNVASRHRRVRRANRRALDDDGFSMIATALSLVATALLTAILLGTMLNSGGSSNGNLSGAPGIAQATALQAQQTLSTGVTTADPALNADGVESVDLLRDWTLDEFHHREHGRGQLQREPRRKRWWRRWRVRG